MKKIVNRLALQLVATVVLSSISLITLAQDKGLDVDINVKKENDWYQQPWVWIVGGAVFVLLLVALLRGNRKDA